MRRWNVNSRDGATATSASQMIGMFLGEAYQRVAELQKILDGEPKLLNIYVHNSDGRKNEAFRIQIDGSFGDAQYMERLISMHLFRLGANKAKSITFNSDGAAWIWGRIDSILSKAKVAPGVTIIQVLDVCHAVENVGKALQALERSSEPTAEATTSSLSELRSHLRDGQWPVVV